MMRKLHALLVLFLFVASALRANVSAPGFWGSGHGATMTPLFAAEASMLSDIQMRQELVLIDLYRNFAVVKGTYWFYNHAKSTHRIHAGYPVNGSARAYPKEHVRFKDLYHLRVQADGQTLATHKLSQYPDTSIANRVVDLQGGISDADNWYVWEMDFPAEKEVRVEVWFIVYTPASMTEGYGNRKANAFEYILQTGAAWKDSILSGNILVTLRDGLQTDDIRGIYPLNSCTYAAKQILYSFSNLKPTEKNDLVIWYDGLGTDPANLKVDSLYQIVAQTDISIIQKKGLPVLEKNDFSTPLPEFVWVLLAGFILGLATLAGIGYLVYRLIKWIF